MNRCRQGDTEWVLESWWILFERRSRGGSTATAPACKEVVGEKNAALQELIGWPGKGKATPGMGFAQRMDEPDSVGWDRSAPYGGLCLAVVGCFIY